VIIDEVVEVNNILEIDKAIKQARRRPVLVIVPKHVFHDLEVQLRKELFLYKVIGMGKKLRVVVFYPDHVIHVHQHINHKSKILADPVILTYIIRNSSALDMGVIDTPIILFNMLRRKHYNYRLLHLEGNFHRAYILRCGNIVLASVLDRGYMIETGLLAFREIFYLGPYKYTELILGSKLIEEVMNRPIRILE